MRGAAFNSLARPESWPELTRDFPRGFHYGHDSVHAVRRIVVVIQRFLTCLGAPLLVQLDEDDDEDEPQAVIVLVRDETHVIPLRFRRRVVHVGNEAVAVAHDDGAVLLARKIVEAVERAVHGE
jgi:hypothetical protein